MFGLPPVSMTDRAATRIKSLMSKNGTFGLKIGLKKGGCAGMEYTMDFVEAAEKNDVVVEHDGARVVLAPTVQMFLFGTEIDYESSLLESGFKFNNPNVTDACGCGESVKFKDVAELTIPGTDVPNLK